MLLLRYQDNMNINQIYQDYSIRSAHENDKHYREGWVNTSCPFCTGNPGNHLGWNLSSNYFFCWRCGPKSTLQTLSTLLGVSFQEAKQIQRKYKNGRNYTPKKINVIKSQFRLPSLMGSILKNKLAFNYMKERGFSKKDLITLEKHYLLKCTKGVSLYDNMDLCYRIIAPIIFNHGQHELSGQMVSWQSRDVTGNSDLKYITCAAKREIIEHKKILYNAPDYDNTVVLCEGIFDVWKVFLTGYLSTCCFGVEYTPDQLKLLMNYNKVLLFLDPDKAGLRNAKRLFKQLLFAGVNAEIVDNKYGKDPGDLSKYEINECLINYI